MPGGHRQGAEIQGDFALAFDIWHAEALDLRIAAENQSRVGIGEREAENRVLDPFFRPVTNPAAHPLA